VPLPRRSRGTLWFNITNPTPARTHYCFAETATAQVQHAAQLTYLQAAVEVYRDNRIAMATGGVTAAPSFVECVTLSPCRTARPVARLALSHVSPCRTSGLVATFVWQIPCVLYLEQRSFEGVSQLWEGPSHLPNRKVADVAIWARRRRGRYEVAPGKRVRFPIGGSADEGLSPRAAAGEPSYYTTAATGFANPLGFYANPLSHPSCLVAYRATLPSHHTL
jgi:hypothetical protein